MAPIRKPAVYPKEYDANPRRSPRQNQNTDLSAEGDTGALLWFVTPNQAQKEFIESTAIAQAQKSGYDRIAIRSNIHDTTRIGPVGNKKRVPCDWHYTADFYNPAKGRWLAAHVYTDTKKTKPERKNAPTVLVNSGLLQRPENPEFHDAGARGHFKPPPTTDNLHYSLTTSDPPNPSSGNAEIRSKYYK
jgi:hypothetical protein